METKHLAEAAKGEPFVIAQDAKPLVRISAIEPEKPRLLQRIGSLEGLYGVPDDFDTMADQEFAEMITIIEEKQF